MGVIRVPRVFSPPFCPHQAHLWNLPNFVSYLGLSVSSRQSPTEASEDSLLLINRPRPLLEVRVDNREFLGRGKY